MATGNETFLSGNVRQLICEAGVTSTLLSECLTEEGLLNWDVLESALLVNESDTSKYFMDRAKSLAPIFNTIHKHFVQLDVNGFRRYMKVYEKYTKWTSSQCQAVWLARQLNEHTKNNGEEILEWFLLYFPLLERSLGDLYLIKGSQCPSMLKDLLVTEELRTLLNSSVMRLLRILIGPPISLNLRNVVWHGFPTPGEIPVQYAHLLLCLLPSIGRLLEANNIDVGNIRHRKFIVLPEISHNFVSNVEDHLNDFENMIDTCDIVFPAMKPVWKLSISRYTTQEYGQCACILLSQLEHYLRCLFAQANQCPHRILTAESAAFFTTFDDMLVNVLPDGSENKLLSLIPINTLDCILDLLNYPEGPRIRDKLSHGEVDTQNVPKEITCHIITVCAALLNATLEQKCPHFLLTEYNSLFHPVSLLKQQLIASIKCLSGWISLPRPNVGEIECKFDWNNAETFLEVVKNLKLSITRLGNLYQSDVPEINISALGSAFQEMSSFVGNTTVHTAFRYSFEQCTADQQPMNPVRNEAEVVGLLRRMTQEVVDISSLIFVAMETRYQQWIKKELRSRQRNTYRRMLDSIPYLSAGMRLIITTATSHYVSLDKIKDLNIRESKLLKLLRFMLQYCENVKANSSLDKNRWDESVELTKELMKKVSAI